MTSSATLAASCYLNGHFRDAAQQFSDLAAMSNADDVDVDCGETSERRRSQLKFLPSASLSILAFRADAALCRVRSELSKPRNDAYSIPHAICEKALYANSCYRRALHAAAEDLILSTVESPKRQEEFITSALLASVSASWLFLKIQNLDLAQQVVEETLDWAASYFMKYTRVESMENRSPTANEILQILSHHIGNRKALRAIQQCLRVLDLKLMNPSVPSEEFNSDRNLTEPDELENTGKLQYIQEQLCKALSWNQKVRTQPEESVKAHKLRDRFLEQAVSVELSVKDSGNTARQIQTKISILQVLEQNKKIGDIEALELSLEKLLEHSPSCRTGYNLLGCSRARCHDKLDDALDSFQKAYHCDNDAVYTIEAISNMAECLLCLGQPAFAITLLLDLLHRRREIPDASMTWLRETSVPLSVHGSTSSCYDHDDISLWRLFLASTLEGDIANCSAVAEKMHQDDKSSDESIRMARIFSLLEGGQATLVLDICRKQGTRIKSHSLAAIYALYEADAAIVTETGFPVSPSAASPGISSVAFLTDKAMTHCDSLCTDTIGDSIELRSLIYNNKGISLIMKSDSTEALWYFQEAVRLQSMCCNGSLQPHFNLALLQWRKGHINDATQTWLLARGFSSLQEKLDNAANLEKLHHALDGAMECYARFTQNSTLGLIPPSHISEQQHGCTETTIRGVNASYFRIIDIILLHCAVELVGKNFVSSRRVSGGLLSQI